MKKKTPEASPDSPDEDRSRAERLRAAIRARQSSSEPKSPHEMAERAAARARQQAQEERERQRGQAGADQPDD